MYGRRCEKCGAYLDPGESCDCEEEKEQERERQADMWRRLILEEKNSDQLVLNLQVQP